MLIKKVSSGSALFDNLLRGGFEAGVITMVYGSAGSGKSNICIIAAMNLISKGQKVIFVDTEGGFSVERAKQINKNYESLAENLILFNPVSFDEQNKIFTDILKLTNKEKKIGLIIIDSIAMLYRLHLGATVEAQETNREMARQLRILSEIARKNKIPVLITNQVYADFENKDGIKVVGGDLLKYWSKAILQLNYSGSDRSATIIKHRSIKEGTSKGFEIINSGLVDAKKKFNLF